MLCKNVRVNTERFSQQSVAIGRRIRAARERHDWTMTELAKRAGVNHSYVSKVEIGAFGTPSVEKLTNIATALGMRLADLTGESEPLDDDVAAQLERFDPADRRLVAEAIDEVLRLARLAAHRAGRRRPTPWVFANPETGLPWSVETLRAAADRAIRAAGLPRISLKDMRATAATVLLDQGEPLPRVSELLGHSSVAVTAKFYQRVLRLTEARAADVAEGLDAAFERAAGADQPAAIRASGTENGTPD